MSTRSQTMIEGSDVVIYRHSDGYPDGKYGVLATLIPFIRDFTKYRGNVVEESDYFNAQLTAAFVEIIHKDAKRAKKHNPSITNESKFLGVGVEKFDGNFHGDVAYVYIVSSDTVKIYTRSEKFWDNPTFPNLTLLDTIFVKDWKLKSIKKKFAV